MRARDCHRRWGRGAALSLGLGLGAALGAGAPARARADVQPILVGNDAMLSGGAVLASVKDAGAAWYNPAGLAFVQQNSVEISAKAFLVRIYSLESLSSVQLPDGRRGEPVSHSEIVAVPTALIFARRLNQRLTGALSLFLRGGEFVRTSDDLWGGRTFAAEGSGASGQRYAYRESFSVIQRSLTYHAGLSIGGDLLPNLRLGFSAFGIFETSDVAADLSTEYAEAAPGLSLDAAPRNVLGNSTKQSLTTFGAEIVTGLQWSPGRGFDLGVTLRTPSWLLGAWDNVEATYLASRALAQGGGAIRYTSHTARAHAEMVQHVRLGLGVAKHLRRGWIAVEGYLSPPLQNPAWGIDRSLIWNLRLGGRFDLGDRFSIGGGLFTDRRGGRAPKTFAEWHPDFYGGVLGGEYRKVIWLGSEAAAAPGSTTPRAPGSTRRALTMATVLALRYSLGYAPFGSPDIDPRGNSLHDLPIVPTRGYQHEIGIHLGSGVHY
jgi:hypothetical protein